MRGEDVKGIGDGEGGDVKGKMIEREKMLRGR